MGSQGEIEPRRDALSLVLGTGDLRQALAAVEANVRDIIDIARARGFVVQFRTSNAKTGEVREAEYFGLPAWQLLGMTYGVTAMVEELTPIEGGWRARAVARTRDGDIVGAAYGLCTRSEHETPGSSGKRPVRRTEHDLAAMAQSRAMRNAMRSAFGAALVLAGFDWADPEAPATDAQVGALHALERQLGLSHEEGHARAGVASYRDLTREDAADLIERWSAEAKATAPVEHDVPSPPPGSADGREPEKPEGEREHPAPAQPAAKVQWERAARHGLTKARAVVAARAAHDKHVPGFERPPTSWTEITADQLAWLIEDLIGP